VLGGDPREDRGAVLHAIGALHLQRVRRGLERDVGAAGVANARQLALQLRRLGVVCRDGLEITSSPVRRSTVVIDAAARPAARHACQSSVAVVVFPSVPVIPTTHRVRLGWS